MLQATASWKKAFSGPKPIPVSAEEKTAIPWGELALTIPDRTAQLETTTSLADMPAISAASIYQDPRPIGAKTGTSHLPSMAPKLDSVPVA